MKKKEFLLRLKLQKGVGYVKLLTITNQMKPGLEIEIDDLNEMDLSEKLINACQLAFNDDKLAKLTSQIERQCIVISFFDEEYPEKLRQIYRPPLILFAQGNLSLLKKDIVTIVGSRYPTRYSRDVINRLVPNLLDQNKVIASGLARGVDALAREATL